MKKITLVGILLGTFSWVNAQVLNQSASWPNPAWTVTGSYATAAAAFESDPLTTSSFAFDDDDAANGHEDNIAAESPVINLTPAFTAGETWLSVTVQYGYRYFANDQLRFEYWNADTSAWVAWGANIPGNSTTSTDNYCTTIVKTTYTTTTLSIAGFTPTQLSGFKYRISYDDDPAGNDWNYGFCFDSPTIVSATPPACPNPSALAAVPAITSAVLSWTENGTATLYNIEYGANGFTQGTGTVVSGVSNSYNLSPLTALTAYSYYVQASCGGASGNSAWIGPFNFTTLAAPPANDDCAGAIALTVNPDYACGTVTAGTTQGATLSMAAAPCFGNPDDDVWFKFVATSGSHKIVLSSIVAVGGTGTSTDAYMQVLSGACGSQTSVLCSDPNTANLTDLTIGDTYYVRVYTYGNTNNITFNICVGTPPPAPANDECTGAIALTVNPDYSCGTVTPGSVASATPSNTDTTACTGTEDDDVWFSFVATSTSHRISILNAAGSVTDMAHSLWKGNCAALSLVAGSCSDPDTSNPTGLTIGETYYVRVYTYTATTGQDTTFNICIGTPPPPPANDDIANAIAVSCGNVYTGNTSLATLDQANPAFAFGVDLDAPNVWYTFTGTGTAQNVNLNLCGSGYDTSVLVLTGTPGNLTAVGGNDDDNTCVSNTLNSNATFTSDGTTTYYIVVEGYNAGSTGAFTMNVTCSAVNPPAVANQDCGTALAVNVDGTDTNSDNSFGTVSSEQPTCDQFGAIQDVWFSFVAPANGEVAALLTLGTMTSLNYNVYAGVCGQLAPVGNCTSNVTTATSTQTYTGLTAGDTYYVQVWSNSVEQGTFTMRLTGTLATGDFDSSNFSYYPNPVKNILNLSYNQEISNVEIFNLLGQKVMTNAVNANTAQIDMSNLSNGAYMVKVTSNNQVKTIKVIKQ
ncbi:T9SS type A sorting domain-containing protein [Flavobacterium wongokense]|uniref:T9SS type A sorting domain-containing protein n=1 Tax=Flavobacterium wongokense TaxID=2910674 RepID=UPI001F4127C1|nr:T9SS type A sorting domain-containing protein [Flavobacterium sp. WG47]MCF6132079.1 T9SS type A sorting domain-containing protein [Flavobacterium sp. WG47]